MPLPKRKKGESEKDFISRCMGDDKLVKEFPDEKQRYAVIQSEIKTNEEKPACVMLTANMSGSVREEVLDGVNYLVAPVVMITEGIHNNLFYPKEELAKYPDAWNNRPVPVYHPRKRTKAVSANSPDVLTERSVGMIFNTKFEDGALKAEAWINPEKADKIDKRILKTLEDDRVMEVSTGLFLDEIVKEGEFNGQKYSKIAVNYRPDHLALLPTGKGACSIEKGAGFPRINSAEELDEMVEAFREFITNEMSFEDKNQKRREALGALLKPEGKGYAYVIATFKDHVIFEKELESGFGTFQQDYSIDENGDYKLVGTPVEVERITSFQPKTNSSEVKVDKKAMIDSIITNGAFVEADRAFLDSKTEEQLKKFLPAEPKKEEPKVNQETKPVEKPVEQQPVINVAELTKQIAAGVKAELQKDQKDAIIAGIVANNAAFKAEELQGMSIGALEQLEKTMNPGSYSMRRTGAPVTNANAIVAVPEPEALFPVKK